MTLLLLLSPTAQADDAPKPLYQKLGLTRKQWERLEAGRTVTRKVKDKQRTVLRGYFIIRATPQEMFALITDYPGQLRLYPDLKQLKVLERSDKNALVYYKGKYGWVSLQWVSRDTFDKDRRGLSWKMVIDKRYPSRISKSEGFWRFTPISREMTLVQYQNDIELKRLPARLLRFFAAANMPGFARNIRRAIVRRREAAASKKQQPKKK